MVSIENDVAIAIEDSGSESSSPPGDSTTSFFRQKKKAIFAALGVMAIAGAALGLGLGLGGSDSSSSGSTTSTPGDDDLDTGSVSFMYPQQTYGVVGKFKQYPGGPESYPTGAVFLTPDNALYAILSNLEASEEGGIHIHAGTSCDDAGGHHYTGAEDGWKLTKWSSNVIGETIYTVDVNSVTGAYGYSDNLDRVVVVHNSNGTKVACAEFSPITGNDIKVVAKLGAYPGYTGEHPRGKARLSVDNVFKVKVKRAAPSTTFGVHIHAGITCSHPDLVLGHHYKAGEEDGWLQTKLTSDADGKAEGEFDLKALPGLHDFLDNVFHAVVVHNENGTRVSCGVLKPKHNKKSDNNWNLGLEGALVPYPGLADDVDYPWGQVFLTSRNVLHYVLYEVSDYFAIHIHEGSSCEAAGGHHYRPGTFDYWTEVNFTANDYGNGRGKLRLNQFLDAYSFYENLDRVMVVHNAEGARVACAVMERFDNKDIKDSIHEWKKDQVRSEKKGNGGGSGGDDEGLEGILETYPGVYDDSLQIPYGAVWLTEKNQFEWVLYNVNGSGGIHIHEGSTCAESGGHWWKPNTVDFWKTVKYTSNEYGNARGGLKLADYDGAYPYEENKNHVVVVHNSDGVRVACAVMHLYTGIKDSIKEWTEDQEKEEGTDDGSDNGEPDDDTDDYDFDGGEGPLMQYPGYTGALAPEGSIFLFSDNVFGWVIYNLPVNSAGGVHLHVGSTCETAGGHHYKHDKPDYWLVSKKWESNDYGNARGLLDLNQYEGAFDFKGNIHRVAVIHDADGNRIACAVLKFYANGIKKSYKEWVKDQKAGEQ